MKINEIKQGMKNFEVEGVITQKDVSPENAKKKWARCVLENDGKIIVWLWNEDADNYNIGDKIKIINAYTRVDADGNLCISKSMFNGEIEKG